MLAYLINQYPKVSHTFIRREIEELERQGWQVRRIALRRCEEALADSADAAESRRTSYVLDGAHAVPRLLCACLCLAVRHPLRLLHAARQALRLGWRAQRPVWYHLVYLAEACQVARQLQAGKVRHLHAHFGTNAAEVAMLASTLAQIPYSFTVHGPEEFDHRSALHLDDKIARAAFVVAVSQFGRSQLYRGLRHADWAKVRVVHCGLDAAFGATAATAPAAAPRVVCVGRLCEQKGQQLLLEAVGRLHHAGLRLHLVLAGDGEMRPALEQLAQRLALPVHITGWLSGEQVRQEILAARAVVLPSFAEGLPVALMEAMALGRPVISTYVAGIPELVTPGRHGWLTPAGDIDALERALRDLLSTPTRELLRMGQAARQQVRERHDLRREVALLGKHFRNAMLQAAPPDMAVRERP